MEGCETRISKSKQEDEAGAKVSRGRKEGGEGIEKTEVAS